MDALNPLGFGSLYRWQLNFHWVKFPESLLPNCYNQHRVTIHSNVPIFQQLARYVYVKMEEKKTIENHNEMKVWHLKIEWNQHWNELFFLLMRNYHWPWLTLPNTWIIIISYSLHTSIRAQVGIFSRWNRYLWKK